MILFLFLGGLLAFSSGSKILFEANPDVIQANLTQTLSMRCSLNDTADAFVGGVVGKRDVTQTASNMQVVTSLVITRNNGEHVATIFGQQPAKALADLSNLKVDGDISGSVGERGYIELTWQYPGTDQVGEYVCEINAVDNQGHNVVFSTSAEIGERQPTIGELMGHILNLEKDKDHLQSQINDITNNLTYIQMPANTTSCPNCSTSTPAPAAPSSVHVESGTIECGDSSSWPQDPQLSWAESRFVTKQFSTPYTTVPHIEAGIRSIDHDQGENVRYDIEVTHIDKNSFTLKCRTWEGSHLFHLWVNWMSIA